MDGVLYEATRVCISPGRPPERRSSQHSLNGRRVSAARARPLALDKVFPGNACDAAWAMAAEFRDWRFDTAIRGSFASDFGRTNAVRRGECRDI